MSTNPPADKPKREPIHFTPTESEILHILSDGQPHSIAEIIERVGTFDDYTTREAVQTHITSIRGKLRPLNHGILVQFVSRKIHYRHVTFVDPSVYQNLLSKPTS